jgi:branched-chain amino acid transport system substrate-binding protein
MDWHMNTTQRLRAVATTVFFSFSFTAAAQEISLAQIGPFTGLPSPDAHEINAGANAYFAEVNAAGGINGRKITLTKFDDQFKGDTFAEVFKKVRDEKRYPILFSPIGSAAMTKLINDKLLDDSGMMILNAIPGSEVFRNPGHPMLFHVRAGDKAQLERIMTHARLLDVRTVRVFHQDLPIGTAGLKVINEIAEKMKGFAISATMAKHDDAALAAAGASIAKEPGIQAVIVIGSPKYCADAIAKLRGAGGGQQVYTLSYVPASLVAKMAGEKAARGVGIVQTFPAPNGRVHKVQRDFQTTMQTYAPDVKVLSHFHFEGYITARVLVTALRRAGSKITAESVATALRSVSPMDFKGFTVDFSKGNQGSQWTDIAVIAKDGVLRY